jgi:hypothetical protein
MNTYENLHPKSVFSKKQAEMLMALERNLCIVTKSAEEVGIARQTHYDWIAANPEYAQAVKELDNVVLDFAETQLHKNMKAQKEASIIFFLKTKGRERGYKEVIDANIKREYANMTDEELDALIAEKRGNE